MVLSYIPHDSSFTRFTRNTYIALSLSDHHHFQSHFCPYMENCYTLPFPPTAEQLPNMGFNQNSDFSSYDEPMNLKNFSSTPSNSQLDHAPQFVAVNYQIPKVGQSFASPVYPFLQGQNGNELGMSSSIHGSVVVQGSCFMQTDEGSMEKERRILSDCYKTKFARIRRRMARQRSLSLQRNGSSLGTSSSNQVDIKRLNSFGAENRTDKNNTQKDLYKFCTPDNKRLKVLLRKELKNSDVGSLGRIVLPKREAELNLPTLSDKEGIHVLLKDANSNQVWTLKYKFWSNNKSRMYVLESSGDFVKQNGLEIGDSLILYEDESKNLYFSIKKVGRAAAEPSTNQHSHIENSSNSSSSNNNSNEYIYMPFTCQSRDEEETSLELLIEQLKHKEQQEANNLMMSLLPMDKHFLSDSVADRRDITNSQMSATTFQTSLNSVRGKTKSAADIQINFDDCYGGLDTLPGFHHYNFSI